MRGSATPDEIKEKAIAMLMAGDNAMYVSERLGLSYNTVKTWQTNLKKKDDRFAEVRNKRREEFVNNAWDIIGLAVEATRTQLKRAKDSGEKINLSQLSTVAGTFYDKQALAQGEATQIQDVHICVDIDE